MSNYKKSFSTKDSPLTTKFCDLIINSRSYSNVVAMKIVEKLKVKTQDHPKLYKI